jgi:hypothetical protein
VADEADGRYDALGMKLLLLMIFSCSLAVAEKSQNSEFSVLAGATSPTAHVIVGPNAIVTGQTGGAVQLAYSYQALSCAAGYLYVEIPVTFTIAVHGAFVGNGVVSSSSNDMSLLTPGVRFKLPIQARLSAYGVAGGGVGWFHKNESRVDKSGVFVGSSLTVHGVFDVGGGLDFRLTRLLSLRGEVRDFISGKNLGGASGRNHPVYELGLAFHF